MFDLDTLERLNTEATDREARVKEITNNLLEPVLLHLQSAWRLSRKQAKAMLAEQLASEARD